MFVSIYSDKIFVILRGSVADQHHVDADPDPAFHFDADPDPDIAFLSFADPDPDPTFKFDPDPTTHFSQDLDRPMLQNDPLRLPPFYFDAVPDPVFHFDADPDPAFHFDADPAPASQMDICGSGSGSATLLRVRLQLFFHGVIDLVCHGNTVPGKPKWTPKKKKGTNLMFRKFIFSMASPGLLREQVSVNSLF